MGQKLGGVGDFAPTAKLKNTKPDIANKIDRTGHMLKGTYINSRGVDTSYGPATVHAFKVLEATCDFERGGVFVEPNEGDTVELFGTSVINSAMKDSRVSPGKTITIVYKGIGKKGKKGNPPHLYDLEVE